jgi:hypothetical protein
VRNKQYLHARHRIGMPTPPRAEPQTVETSAEWVAAAIDALDVIESVVADRCFEHPDALTQDGITAYALALIRLRECAGAAGCERLMNACDALAVTVSRLIEDRNCVCRQKWEALTQFVEHAQAMIQMSAGVATQYALSVPAMRDVAQTRAFGR